VLAAAQKGGDIFTVPKLGQSIEPGALPAIEHWWPSLPWQTAEQHPIVSTQVN
jgi:hypothetical protein